jgi:pyruvate formate lyase activating enzyme
MSADTTTKGFVLKIDKFSTHDGPGIRTVIFLKGCPLSCLWCSTPDSQKLTPELTFTRAKCLRCGKCVAMCPSKAISLNNKKEPVTDRLLCKNCGKCVEVCNAGARAMSGREMTVKEVMDEVEKDSLFYWNSGGGVTLSGGEATLQAEFSKEILKACQREGFHTAIETCGYVKWETLNELLPYLNLVYVDIKHFSAEKHKALTGKTNQLILDNIQRIAETCPTVQLIIRIPVMPGLNDSKENIRNVAKFVSQLPGNHKIELLPYHKLGSHKYEALGRAYKLSNLESPSDEDMYMLKELIEKTGVPAQIGG